MITLEIKCPGPVTLDGRCLGGRNTYQKEGVGMNRSLHKGKGKDGGDNLTEPVNEVGIFKISQFTKGIIPQGRLDTHTPEKKKEAIKLIKNFHSMLNAFWRENDIPYRARLNKMMKKLLLLISLFLITLGCTKRRGFRTCIRDFTRWGIF